MNKYLDIAPEVQSALSESRPVVALESTIISHGMPYPQNVETALRVEKTIRDEGAVPATIAVIGGRLKAGLSEAEIEYLGRKGREVAKASRRDLPVLVARGADGATTVTTTMIIADMAGIKVFATGGIGGVHRGAETTMDISADLEELARTPVMVICAGAKSILDLGLTLEYLETKGVPVIGYGTDELPAFYTRRSGFGVDYRIDTPEELAAAFKAKLDMGLGGGMLVTNPIPEEYSMDPVRINTAIDQAVAEAARKGIHGKETTPFLLARIKDITGGDSLASNIQLVLNNARLAAATAACLLASVGAVGQTVRERPNILFIVAEDMTLDLSCYGRTDVSTPNIDRLASEGVVYTNARCVAPLSSPTRSAMMTGLHHEMTASHNHRSHRDVPLPEDITPFPVLLRDAGYTTVLGDAAAFENPVTHADHESSRKIDCNFRYDPIGAYDGKTSFGLFDRLYQRPEQGPWFQQITLYVTHRGDWWQDITRQSAHPVDPASVSLPPYLADHPKIREEFACYLDQVEYMDAEVGRILDELLAEGRLDSTVIIFIADNGRADLRAKGWMYNDGTRIPMIIRAPGLEHKVVDDLVSELDIPATILSLAGVERPSYYQGNVLEAFSGKPAAHQWLYLARDTWDEVQECIRSVTDERYIYVRNYQPQIPYTARHCYTYCYRPALHIMKRLKEEGKLNSDQLQFFAESKPVEELYDYRSDDYCLCNLASEPSKLPVLNKMRELMDSWQGSHRDAGVEDHLTRKLPDDRADFRRQMYFASRFRPDEWAEIEDGAICDSYDRWKAELKQMQAENAVTLSEPIIKVGDNKQAAFICDDHVVAFFNGGRAQAFSLKDGELKSTFYLGSSGFAPHCNVADYVRKGGKGYAYVSAWDGTKHLFVEQIKHSGGKWSSTLVQTVTADAIPVGLKGAGQMDWVPDFEAGKLYSVCYKEGHWGNDIHGSTKLVILEFPMPAIKKGTVNFTESDIIRRSDIPIYLATQDKEIHGGKLYILAGLKNKDGLRDPARNHLRVIAVVDLETLRLEKEIRLDFYNREPEGIEFIGDDMYLTYYKDALYKVNRQ